MNKNNRVPFIILFFVFIFIIYIILIHPLRTPYFIIKTYYNLHKSSYDYVTNILYNQNTYDYFIISCEYEEYKDVTYRIRDKYYNTDYESFLNNFTENDRAAINDLVNKCNLKQIYFVKNEYIQYVNWVFLKYARGIVYSEKEYKPIDADVVYCKKIKDNYYLFEEH